MTLSLNASSPPSSTRQLILPHRSREVSHTSGASATEQRFINTLKAAIAAADARDPLHFFGAMVDELSHISDELCAAFATYAEKRPQNNSTTDIPLWNTLHSAYTALQSIRDIPSTHDATASDKTAETYVESLWIEQLRTSTSPAFVQKALEHGSQNAALFAFVQHFDASSQQVSEAYHRGNDEVKCAAIQQYPSLFSRNIIVGELASKKVKLALLQHDNCGSSVTVSIYYSPNADNEVKCAAVQHKNAHLSILNHAAKNGLNDVLLALMDNPNAQNYNIRYAYDRGNDDVKCAAVRHKNAPLSILNHAAKYGLNDVLRALMDQPNAQENHIRYAYDNGNNDVKCAAVRHWNARNDLLSKALDDACRTGSNDVLLALLCRGSLSAIAIQSAYDHGNDDVKYAAVRHWNVGNGLRLQALRDMPQCAKMASCAYTYQNDIRKAVSDNAKLWTINNPTHAPEVVNFMMKHCMPEQRLEVLAHPNASVDTVQAYLQAYSADPEQQMTDLYHLHYKVSTAWGQHMRQQPINEPLLAETVKNTTLIVTEEMNRREFPLPSHDWFIAPNATVESVENYLAACSPDEAEKNAILFALREQYNQTPDHTLELITQAINDRDHPDCEKAVRPKWKFMITQWIASLCSR